MPLSCECDDDYDEFYIPPSEYTVFSEAFSCASCCEKSRGLGIEFKNYKINDDDEEIPLSSSFFCERCADIYFSLNELGFCIELPSSMLELLEEYHRDYVPRK